MQLLSSPDMACHHPRGRHISEELAVRQALCWAPDLLLLSSLSGSPRRTHEASAQSAVVP